MVRLPPLHNLTAFEAAALESATARLRNDTRERLRISAAPALGAKWFVARLAGFQRAHPKIKLAVSSSYDLEPIKPFALEVRDRAYTIVLATEAQQKPARHRLSQSGTEAS